MRKKTGHDAIHYMYMVAVSMVGLTVLSFVGLRSAVVLAEPLVVSGASPQTASATATVQVTAACSMTANVVAHSATITNGIYYDGEGHNGIGLTTLKTTCNDASGYAIYAVGYTGEVIGGANSTKLVGVKNSNNTIVTGTSQSGPDSNWAMRIGTTGSSYVATVVSPYNNFAAVPSNYAKVAYYNSNTDTGAGATGSSVTATYAAYISGTQAADTYNGKVRYTMVHPADEVPLSPQPSTAGYINYYANASTAVGTMGRHSASDGNTVKLFASNFSREGYGFAGWSDAFDYATNPNAHFYGPNEDITVPTGTTANGLALYAVWVESAGTMQANGASVCNSLTAATYNDEGDSDESTWSISANLNSISALTDTRDGNTYAIARLTDGNCWMIENLRLADKDSNNNDVILSSANTNSPSLPLTNVYDTNTTSNHLSPTSSIAYTEGTAPEGWCSANSAACDDQSRIRTDNTADRATYITTTNMSSHSVNLYSYGNYYNWYSATAGNGTYAKNGGTTDGDICPTGWHLPNRHPEFGLLSNSLGGYKSAEGVAQYMSGSTTPTGAIMQERLRHFPNNLLYSGTVSGSSISRRGNGGYYWSSSGNGYNNAYDLFFNSNNTPGVYPGNGTIGKYSGNTVRCMVAPSS